MFRSLFLGIIAPALAASRVMWHLRPAPSGRAVIDLDQPTTTAAWPAASDAETLSNKRRRKEALSPSSTHMHCPLSELDKQRQESVATALQLYANPKEAGIKLLLPPIMDLTDNPFTHCPTEQMATCCLHSKWAPFEIFGRLLDGLPGTPNTPRRRVTGKLGDDGKRHAVAGEPAKANPDPGGLDDLVWIVVYSSNGQGLGTQVSPPDGVEIMLVGGLSFKLYSKGGSVLLVRGVAPEEAGAVSELLKAGSGTVSAEDKDVRVLPVLFDTAEERWRTVAEAVADHEEIDFTDFPLQGPRTICRDARQLRRLGLDFVQHHEAWCRKSGVRSGDRSVHEHASLCRALNLMM